MINIMERRKILTILNACKFSKLFWDHEFRTEISIITLQIKLIFEYLYHFNNK